MRESIRDLSVRDAFGRPTKDSVDPWARHHDVRHKIAPTSPPNSRLPGIDIAPGDRYVVNGVVPPGYAYSARQHPPRDWLTKFAFPPEGYRTPRMGQLEQNRAS